jgi:hypothetical protein
MNEYVARPEPLRGYRELTDDERALVDEIKQLEVAYGRLWARVVRHPDVDRRSLALAKTEGQDAFMWLVRAVTRPLDVFDLALGELDET